MKRLNFDAIKAVLAFLFVSSLLLPVSEAQYFGRNKARYEHFDFEVYKTPHFELYHYVDNAEFLEFQAQQCENWYTIHQQVLKDTFDHQNPIIFYNNHADFQQTTAISGDVSVGTGGVTESLKNRVIMPFTESNEQTDHVLGHELVHAFQFNMLINGDSTSLNSMQYLPLWLIEGMAEYLSLGRVDAHTAMWMRDAVANNNVPTIKEMNNPKYFPYRYGQAFWAFLTGMFGDEIIEPFFMAAAKNGVDDAISQVLGTDGKNLSALWKSSLENHFGQNDSKSFEAPPGRVLIDEKNAGKLNISPVISPNGKYVIFLSEKSVFSLDLFLADARTGKIIRKVASTTRDGDVDAISYLESAGTWSPDSKRFAYVVFSKGKNKLVIKEVSNGKTWKEMAIPKVEAFSNPTWSPDGNSIAVTGLVNGYSDLYQFNLKNQSVRQLTNDKFSDLQAKFSPDGSKLVFSTDRISMTQGQVNGKWFNNIALLDLNTLEVENIDLFHGADNFNPEFFESGNEIAFLSNRDGYRNIYKYNLDDKSLSQVTNLLTGVSGITHLSPAFSIARKTDSMVFSWYTNSNYQIYKIKGGTIQGKPVKAREVDFTAATLPPLTREHHDKVLEALIAMETMPAMAKDSFKKAPYKSKFKMDYIGGNTGVAIGAGNLGGTGLVGGVDMIFSDMLGRNQLYTGFVMNGELQDFGGQIAYVNQKRRLAWGVSLSHIPYRSGSFAYAGVDTLFTSDGDPLAVDKFFTDIQRTFEDKLNVFAYFPISKTKRFEIGTSLAMYNNSLTRTTDYVLNGSSVAREKERLQAPPGFNLVNLNAAFVGDNSYFGVASPLKGQRYRIGVEQYFGAISFQTVTADYRKYLYMKPFSIGFRAMHYGRYGSQANQLTPFFVGNPVLVRGYNINRVFTDNSIPVNQLVGSKLLISNFEIRLPFSGPENLSLIKSNFMFTELALFVDGGLAWNNFNEFGSDPENIYTDRKPVFSTGVSMRVNLFGAMVLEPYYAFPIQKNMKGVFGLNIIPGW
ncbi:MAG: basic secretory protein-like protein [Bacteroidota bacterium]